MLADLRVPIPPRFLERRLGPPRAWRAFGCNIIVGIPLKQHTRSEWTV
jgi:hypothetical protein